MTRADTVPCPRCGAEVGRPCWRTYPVLPATLRAAEVPVPGYCQARAQLARDGGQVATVALVISLVALAVAVLGWLLTLDHTSDDRRHTRPEDPE